VDELDRARELGSRESGLAVLIAQRKDGSPYASVVNAGVLAHPVTGDQVVGFVARGGTRKLPNLRRSPRVTVVFRSGWEWVAIEGNAELAGPDDPLVGVEGDRLVQLLRRTYAAAVGGAPDDWKHLDQDMVEERHTAVLIRPSRCYFSTP
jgi:PPOX class probable F420-dependent enzyme